MDKIAIGLLISLAVAVGLVRDRYGKPERLGILIMSISLPAWLYLFWLK